MSGGSMDYICYTIQNYLEDQMEDPEMNDLIRDIVVVTKALEWWKSGDTEEDAYRTAVSSFKKKWFKVKRNERLIGYVDKEIDKFKDEMLKLF